MLSFLGFLVVLALISTLGILLAGVIGMLRGTEFNKKYGNVMMRARIASQAITVVLLLVYFLVAQRGA